MVRIIENYTLYEVIGEGAYGKVYRAVNKLDNKEYAVKVIEVKKFLANKKLEECTVHEINILTNIEKNNHIITYYDMLKTQNNFYFVYQYCNGGTLEGILRKEHTLNQKNALLIFKQLIEAFQVLNKYNIMHRDLKPDNIFFHNGIVKVGDFGFCKSLEKAQMTKTMLGSPIYMAPEILNGQIYSNKADIWSIGVVLYEMLYGYCPFESNSIPKLIQVLKQTELDFPSDIVVSNQTKNLLKRILTKDPQRRIEWMDLFKINITQEGKLLDQNRGQNLFSGMDTDLSKNARQVNDSVNEDSPTTHQKSRNFPQGFSSPRNVMPDTNLSRNKNDEGSRMAFLRKTQTTVEEAETVSPVRRNKSSQVNSARDKMANFHGNMMKGINIARSMGLNQQKNTPLFSYYILKSVSDQMKQFRQEEVYLSSHEGRQIGQIFEQQIEQLEHEISLMKGKIEEVGDWKKAVKSKVLQFKNLRLCYELVMFMSGQQSSESISHNQMSYVIRSKIA